MIVVVLTGLAVPYLVKVAIDAGIQAGDLDVLNLVIVAFVAVSAVNLGASYAQTYLTSWVGEHVILDLRRALFAHIQKLSMDFFSRQKTGWIVSRLTNDIDALSQLVTDGVTSLVTNGLTFAGAIVFLFILDWRLALATMTIMPLVVGATLVFRARSARAYALVRDRIADVSAHLQESISGVRVLKAFRREAADRAAPRARQRGVPRRQHADRRAERPVLPVRRVHERRRDGRRALVRRLAGGDDGELEDRRPGRLHRLPGELLRPAAAALAALQHLPVLDGRRAEGLHRARHRARHARRAPTPCRCPTSPASSSCATSRSATTPTSRSCTTSASTVPAGRTVALVGATGAGKSTLVKLLARFYDPQQGAVLIDGHDLRDVTSRSLREQLAVVPQEAFLFSGSVLDNIRFARPSADPEEVKRVARIVGAHDFIAALPDGYETEVQEGGGGLSTGQRQLISFARALLADPRVLILDEATSSVDAESERRIEHAMDVLFSGRTSVIVAHRLSTVRYADEILVVDAGRIVERGTHAELLDRRRPLRGALRRMGGDRAGAVSPAPASGVRPPASGVRPAVAVRAVPARAPRARRATTARTG